MNDKDKQIRQMACAMCGNARICVGEGVEKCLLYPTMWRYANNAYREGYRKQSDGEWIKHPLATGVRYCSNCGENRDSKSGNFCPNCGAKMFIRMTHTCPHNIPNLIPTIEEMKGDAE